MHILPPHTPQFFLIYAPDGGLHVRLDPAADRRISAVDAAGSRSIKV
jgi:hypothetical protein